MRRKYSVSNDIMSEVSKSNKWKTCLHTQQKQKNKNKNKNKNQKKKKKNQKQTNKQTTSLTTERHVLVNSYFWTLDSCLLNFDTDKVVLFDTKKFSHMKTNINLSTQLLWKLVYL